MTAMADDRTPSSNRYPELDYFTTSEDAEQVVYPGAGSHEHD